MTKSFIVFFLKAYTNNNSLKIRQEMPPVSLAALSALIAICSAYATMYKREMSHSS